MSLYIKKTVQNFFHSFSRMHFSKKLFKSYLCNFFKVSISVKVLMFFVCVFSKKSDHFVVILKKYFVPSFFKNLII